ncbi:MAG: ectoine hydroxylase-related dioxygenase (phytanoyl-CoA dioxygenase family) [Planctomycetota bacterium]|jgi:ectoine hydroxylase-related dioxygenase (phytanoyl-CoA dioxygenase family)
MLKRAQYLWPYDGEAPEETLELERDGHCILRGVFGGDELAQLRSEVLDVYANFPDDDRANSQQPTFAGVHRYGMCNRSALSQRAMAHARVLEVVEPLLGGDCHIINSTAWRNPAGEAASPGEFYWHIDAGPHVPRAEGVVWPANIPYPIFVIATHIYLDDCSLDDGPTTVVPASHRTGRPPEPELRFGEHLQCQGAEPVSHIVSAGDVGFFVSDVWHRRRLPTSRSTGRLFLQTNYGRRDIAQRLVPAQVSSQVSAAAEQRATTDRERTLLGLHPPAFYDS